MHPQRLAAALVMVLVAAGTAAIAGSNLIANGGFEAAGPIPSWRSLSAGSSVGAWRVTSGTAALVGAYWRANGGTNSLEVGSPGAGTVAQTIATTAGRHYRLAFALAGNPDGPPRVKTLVVTAGPVTRRFTFDVSGRSRSAMGWTPQTLDFVAAASSTVIAFARLDGGASAWWGPAVDDVSVTEAGAAPPVPATTAPTAAPAMTAAPAPAATAAPRSSVVDAFAGLWRAAYPAKALRVYVEHRGANVVGHTVDGDGAIPTGTVAFTGRVDGKPVVVLAKCSDADAHGWHGAVIEWSGPDAFHLRVADCHAGDVLYTRWRSER